MIGFAAQRLMELEVETLTQDARLMPAKYVRPYAARHWP
jgi:hypothetical protein